MIAIYKHSDNGLMTLAEPISGVWINVVDPSPVDIEQLQKWGITPDYITYPLDMDERARTERENGAIFILLRIPIFHGSTVDIPYITVPLGIILTDQYVITICKQENDILRELISGRVRSLSTGKRNRFVLRVLLSTASKYLADLLEINRAVDTLEDQLQQSTRNKEVLELLKYQKSLTIFTTALKSNELMMERLSRSQLFKMYPEDEDLFEDVLTENQQAIEMTNISSNILSSMMDAFASIISNNMNTVMKFLTSITIVVSLPTIIASLYGMNVTLPLQNNPFAFMITLLIAFVVMIGVAVVFWKRDWL